MSYLFVEPSKIKQTQMEPSWTQQNPPARVKLYFKKATKKKQLKKKNKSFLLGSARFYWIPAGFRWVHAIVAYLLIFHPCFSLKFGNNLVISICVLSFWVFNGGWSLVYQQFINFIIFPLLFWFGVHVLIKCIVLSAWVIFSTTIKDKIYMDNCEKWRCPWHHRQCTTNLKRPYAGSVKIELYYICRKT